MEKLTYTKVGDYLIPNLKLDSGTEPEERYPLGKYGRMREHYLKEHRHGTYSAMLLTGKLAEHLREVDERAQEQVDALLKTLMERDGVDEKLKADDQMLWVQRVNNLMAQAEEMVLPETVYA